VPSAGSGTVHSALLHAVSGTVRSSTSRFWPSRTVTSTGVPAAKSSTPVGVFFRRMALNCAVSPRR
jgi:hypothetical protein